MAAIISSISVALGGIIGGAKRLRPRGVDEHPAAGNHQRQRIGVWQ